MTRKKTPDNSGESGKPGKRDHKEKKSIAAVLLKGLLALVLALVLLIAGAGIVLQYFFPSRTVTPIAERELSRILRLPVNIGGIEFSLLSGARVREIRIGGDLLSVREVVLDYDLTQLLGGNLVINEVTIDAPELKAVSTQGRWNFQPLLERGGSPQPGPQAPQPRPQAPQPPPAAPPATGLPPVPVGIDLKKLAVNSVKFALNMDGETTAFAEGLNIEARGKVQLKSIDLQLRVRIVPGEQPNLIFSSNAGAIDFKSRTATDLILSASGLEQIRLNGSFALTDNSVSAGKTLPSPDISGEVLLTANIKRQLLNLENLSLRIAEKGRLELSGEVEHVLADPHFQILLKEASFDVEELVALASGLIPPIEAAGEIGAADFRISGKLPGFKPELLEALSGTVTLKNLSVDHPALDAHLKGLNGSTTVKKIRLRNLAPEILDLETSLDIAETRFREIGAKGVSHQLAFTGQGSNLAHLGFSVSVSDLAFAHPEMGTLRTSLRTSGSMDGDLLSGNIPAFKVSYGIGRLLDGEVSGDVSDFGKKSLHSAQSLKIRLGEIAPLLPPKLKDKIQGVHLGGEIRLHSTLEGRLNPNFMPVALKLRSGLEVRELVAAMANPELELSGLSASIAFPAEFDAERGVFIPEIEINSRTESIKALKNFEVGPSETKTRMTMQEFFNFNTPGIIPVSQQTTVNIQNILSKSPEINLSGLKIDTGLTGAWHPGDFRDALLNGTVSIQFIDGLKKIRIENILANFNINAPGLSLEHIGAVVKTTLGSSTLKEGDLELALDPVTMEASVKMSPALGDIRLERMLVDSPSLLHLEAKGAVGNRGKSFSLDEMSGNIRLDALWQKIPESLRGGMPDLKLSGTARVNLSGKGALPKPADLKNLILPFTLAAGFSLEDARLDLPGQGLKIEGLSSSTSLNLKQDHVEISGNIAPGKIFAKQIPGDVPLEPQFKFLYNLKDFDKLTFVQHEASLKNLGLTHKLSGSVEGLKPFLTGAVPVNPAEILRRVNLALSTENRLQIGQTLSAPSQGIGGALTSHLSVSLAGGKSVEAGGSLEFDRFLFYKLPLVRAGPVNGEFIFSKKLVLDKSLLDPQKKSGPVAQRGFFQQVREFSPYKNILTVGEIDIAGQKVSGIGLDLFFKDNQLMVEKFLFDVLGGSAGGNLFLVQDAEGPALKFSTEFTNLDFGKLVKPLVEGGESGAEVDGNVQLELKVRKNTPSGKISLDQLKLHVAVTRIGAETLDRFLLFLDPEESKPAIVDIRAKLKLASPHRLLVTLENGNLNVEAWLKNKVMGTILKAPELKRVPISSLKQFKQISDALQALANLESVLKYLSANGIAFDEGKGMTLF